MDVTVKKRDGRLVPFDESKISNAMYKALIEVFSDDDNKEVMKSTAELLAGKVVSFIMRGVNEGYTTSPIDIEIIQDWIENCLMDFDKKVAKAYITYRYKRKLVRDKYSALMEGVKEKISASNVQNQNANVDEHSFGGRVGETSDYILKQYALDNCMSEMSKNNHLNNEIYIHDLSAYAIGMHNCLTVPFDDLLAKGFNTRQVDIRPAQSVNTAFQLVAVIFQIQSLQQFGGVSASHLDWTMVPYVKKSFLKHYMTAWLKDSDEFENLDLISLLFDTYEEKINNQYKVIRNKFEDWIDEHKNKFFMATNTKESDYTIDNKQNLISKYYQSALYDTIVEIKQAVEGMYHNLNSLQSRSGNQLPFSSINYGTCTSTEGRLITKALLDASIKGVGRLHKTSIFPCGIFQCMKGVNRKKGDPNYDLFQLALISTAKRLYPNYANCNWSGNAGYDRDNPKTYFSTMGKCKLQLI